MKASLNIGSSMIGFATTAMQIMPRETSKGLSYLTQLLNGIYVKSVKFKEFYWILIYILIYLTQL